VGIQVILGLIIPRLEHVAMWVRDLDRVCAFYADHFGAFALGSAERVDALTARLKALGVPVLDGPRRTGDGYYESVVLDPGPSNPVQDRCEKADLVVNQTDPLGSPKTRRARFHAALQHRLSTPKPYLDPPRVGSCLFALGLLIIVG
jgi:hypothetical protein